MAIPDNKRIFYACQAVVIEPFGAQSAESEVMHGLQSVGVTTNFNLEQAFESVSYTHLTLPTKRIV